MDFTTSAKYQNNPILRETFGFAVLIVQYAEVLEAIENMQLQDKLFVQEHQLEQM